MLIVIIILLVIILFAILMPGVVRVALLLLIVAPLAIVVISGIRDALTDTSVVPPPTQMQSDKVNEFLLKRDSWGK
jgi:hypothetical protein